MKVLIVDDDDRFHRMYERPIQAILGDDIQFLHEYDGSDGALCYERNPDIGLIITDNQMLECDGIKMVRLIREWEQVRCKEGTHVPIIMVTGSFDQSFAQHASEVGMDSVLAKPVTVNAFLRAIETIFPKQ